MNEDVHRFIDLLKTATAAIAKEYFMLPVAGSPDGIWRERVYCYELYHQLRNAWPKDFPYSLGGEVDKSAHPLLLDPAIHSKKPDFIIHSPGSMDRNLIIMEVKTTARMSEVEKDIQTLKGFKEVANYQAGVLLIFGLNGGAVTKLKSKIRELGVPLTEFYLLHHEQADRAATKLIVS